jgi:type I restriction enzyme S subunit
MPFEDHELDRYGLRKGDVLVCEGGEAGRAAIWDGRLPDVKFQKAIHRVRPGPDLFGRFLVYRLMADYHSGRLADYYTGATIKHLTGQDLARYEIPLPPLAEQRRIAEVLDRAEALRAKRRAGLAQLDTVVRASFDNLFMKGLDGPAVDISDERSGVQARWSWELLTDAASLATGHTPDRERADYWNGDIPWISLTDIRDLDAAVASRTIQNVTALGIENSSSVRLPAGTVCFSRTASVGFVTVMGSEMATSQDFVNWVCGPRLDATYLMWALIGARPRLRAFSSGSTHKTIYVRVVERFRVLIPPLALQREFARRVAAVEKLKTAYRASLAEMDALFASLQHRAFRGEL